ncbi:hypothetical protein EVAR_24897_1 [Eumeta japonica]|uniref:Uncharacterized protein n=1 Tax=Eumeta variegata TaxID=151549 RepID=A0A4C1V570_EUMVA|nr:hypothetical protein EVAR_24897_1 [Eumeta japonica]
MCSPDISSGRSRYNIFGISNSADILFGGYFGALSNLSLGYLYACAGDFARIPNRFNNGYNKSLVFSATVVTVVRSSSKYWDGVEGSRFRPLHVIKRSWECVPRQWSGTMT